LLRGFRDDFGCDRRAAAPGSRPRIRAWRADPEQAERIVAQERQIAGQAERLEVQEQQTAGQAERIAAQEAVGADLREQREAAERAGSRNSGNSSMPPSSDDLPGKKQPRKQRRAAERGEKKRKRGKQPGSPGASMTWEVPDRTEDHYPEGSCPCGLDLADAEDLGVARSYQQEEIPVVRRAGPA
jgi:hypothetical protein